MLRNLLISVSLMATGAVTVLWTGSHLELSEGATSVSGIVRHTTGWRNHELSYRYGDPDFLYVSGESGNCTLAMAPGVLGLRTASAGLIWVWSLPFSTMALLSLAYPSFVVAVWRLRCKYRIRHRQCIACGYDLRGSVSGICTECGQPIESAMTMHSLRDHTIPPKSAECMHIAIAPHTTWRPRRTGTRS